MAWSQWSACIQSMTVGTVVRSVVFAWIWVLAPPHDLSKIVRTLSDSWIPAIGPGQSWSGVHFQASAASCWVKGPRTIPMFFSSSKVALISSVNSLADG